MMKAKTAVSALAASLALAAAARTFEIAAWRGETVAALVPDFAELAPAMDDISVRYGTLKSVKYAPKPGSLQRLEVYDRVKWDADDAGPRVVEVTVPAGAKPGVYDCGMMRVRVVDRVLPPAKEWKFYLDLWQHPWATARIADAKPFSKKHYKAMKPVYELLATAGQKTITVPIVDLPWDHQCADAYHSMIDGADYRLFDEYVQFCLDCGLGPDISCYSLCPWTLGKTIDEAELERRWGEKLEKFAAHVKEKGWFAHTLMAMDERAPEDVAKVAAFVQRHAPGMRISMAGNRRPSDFKGITIDVYAQVLRDGHVTPEFLAEAAERAKKGHVTTHYVCCSPNTPNTFMDSGPGEAFWCGAAPAFIGLDGFLRWAWNSWPQDPCKDASYGNWRAGDTFLCYPKGEPSWRFLELRNGIVAAEKVRILKESGALDAAAFAKLVARYDVKAANDGTCDFVALRKATLDFVNAR
ncbi:MAG: DUF4091 domain-containing protein [Kiritimatiellae bacterium]|nr:DUF4091 domain-containing protein [Kiritimatiellia bacterium]